MDITVYFKRLSSLRLSILAYSKCTADREPEGRMLLEEWCSGAIRSDCTQKSRVVGEVGSVRDNGRLQICPHQQGVVRPIYPERRIHHGQQHLQLEASGHARRL